MTKCLLRKNNLYHNGNHWVCKQDAKIFNTKKELNEFIKKNNIINAEIEKEKQHDKKKTRSVN